MKSIAVFPSILLALFVLTGCGGPSRPELPKVELPESDWPELTLLIEAVKPLRGGSSEDETLILQVFQQAQLATHTLLEGDVPSGAAGPETTQLLDELREHQKSMRNFDQFSAEGVLKYFQTATSLAEIAGLEAP